MRRAVRLVATVLLAALVMTSPAAAAPPAVPLAVIAIDPDVELGPVLAAATAAGFAPVVVTLPPIDDAPALAEAEAGLEAARAAWLAQRSDELAAALDRVEARSLVVLARPEQSAALWQLAFLRGLAAMRDDAPDAATPWFMLALELAPARRPEPGTYPPAVDGGFALAVDEQGRRVARAVTLAITPADARVVIDGVPVIDRGRPRLLRRGLHAVLVEAAGFVASAQLVEVADRPLVVALTPEPGPAAAALAPLAARGLLDLDGPSAQAVVRAAAAAAGAEVALIVSARGARLIRTDRAAPWQADAAAALAPSTPAPAPAPPPPTRSRRWLLWGGVAVGAAVAAIVTVMLITGDAPEDRTHIGFTP